MFPVVGYHIPTNKKILSNTRKMIPTKLKIPQYTVVATRNGNPFLVGPVTVSHLCYLILKQIKLHNLYQQWLWNI